jgi:hypothetical protein
MTPDDKLRFDLSISAARRPAQGISNTMPLTKVVCGAR